MTKRQWHSGPPPSVGWWPASLVKDEMSVRWWDGVWSVAVGIRCSAETAASFATMPSLYQEEIKWTERWWE